MTDNKAIEKQIRGLFSGKDSGQFRPVAFFDEELDCIRIVVKDASVTEHRIDGLLTILEDNYPEDAQRFVGFTIKGAKHFCKTHGLGAHKAVTIAELLDALISSVPAAGVRFIVDSIARPLIESAGIEDKKVEIPGGLKPSNAMA